MRRARITYKEAYHHIMNRGINGEKIFAGKKNKEYFLDILKKKAKIQKVKLLAYCIMDNHYHLILQNTSGKLSDFMKHLNAQYGIYYRHRKDNKGYVFQGRYKSTLIQKDEYLKIAIVYVLLNPIRAGIITDFNEYQWSSIGEYFKAVDSDIVDNKFVEKLFESRKEMNKFLKEWVCKSLDIKKTRVGDIIGSSDFESEALKLYERRKGDIQTKRMRIRDYVFEPAEDIIRKFSKNKGIEIEKIDITTFDGKKLRAELLVLLKDKAGLKYTEIIKYLLFKSLKYASLGQLYKRAKQEIKE